MFHNIFPPMAKSSDNGGNLTTALNPLFEECLLKLSNVAQTALGTVVKPAVHCRREQEQGTSKANKREKARPQAVCKCPLHHCDSVSCLYQTSLCVYLLYCIFHAVTTFYPFFTCICTFHTYI